MTTVMATTVARNAHGGQMPAGDRNKTAEAYGLIRDGKYDEAAAMMEAELEVLPTSRAGLSLLAYCRYHSQKYDEAADAYGRLVRCCPEVSEYRVYLAQSLHQAGRWAEAGKAARNVDDPQHATRMLHLQAAIKYEEDDMAGMKGFVDRCLPDEPETLVARGCMAYKEGDFLGAARLFGEAMSQVGYQPDLAYNTAVCCYKTDQFGQTLKHVAEIIDRGVREHPELGVGSNTDGLDVRSVGNTQALKETALVEAFNLRSAVEFRLSNLEAAREALSDMPPRAEEELDPVTLHNLSLAHMEEDPTGGFRKLTFLLGQPPFPPETFGNLLLLYVKYEYYDLAADVLADNVQLHQSCLSQELYDYLEATIHTQSAPDEAYRKFDALARRHTEQLRKLTKQIQDARMSRDTERIKVTLNEYDAALDRFMPVLMAQAKIYWNLRNYSAVERVFRASAEFCSEHETWKLNLAHVFFMQGNFRDAIRYYEPIVRQHDRILDVTAVVLANLCVAFIMTSQNDDAEELMRQIEREEERQAYEQPDKQTFHLCIVNTVIGTLYCAKGNFEFGLSRIFRSLEPFETKLGADTWFYAKRCVLAVCEQLAKHTLLVQDAFFDDLAAFLDQCERHGAGIVTKIDEAQGQRVNKAIHNVAYEARLLKRLLLKLRD